MEIINGLGRRKAAVARVYLKQGSGNITVNGKDYKEFFPVDHVQGKILEPLTLVDVLNIYDLKVNVRGGGIKGQAEAVRLGIARALCKINEEFREPLKAAKLLSRDSRVVERKKYGKPKARKSFQFSKR
ncbi:30S ribosomal protein S9 [Aureispira anguillae]|uniref:Small ribosomal subunit protein uS9 n=1 Tax=Aureispira anguillae TaxID=2864201 RepID=A0A916DW94_9BACT|nr:30S ribosomal protein S9 [Aureispira anguillae]BDS14577.1 30S ribosomal protein S9 [Aureispira anguillae]